MCVWTVHLQDYHFVPPYMMVSQEEFQSYTQIKAYDVISSGNFKRHLSQCRDNGDRWAVQMYSHQNAIQNQVKEVFLLVSQLTSPNSTLIQRVCKDVMSCAQPPIRVLTGRNVCCLSGVSTDHCIDLTRVGKNSKEILVHPRFWHFFVLLWFCAKLEYVIRACTKQWLDLNGVHPIPSNYTELCEEFSLQNHDLVNKLYELFVKGVEYISISLNTYKDKYALKPVLIPTKQYWADESEPKEKTREIEQSCTEGGSMVH